MVDELHEEELKPVKRQFATYTTAWDKIAHLEFDWARHDSRIVWAQLPPTIRLGTGIDTNKLTALFTEQVAAARAKKQPG